MTPEQQAYRDLWIAEMWPTVHEWRQTKDERCDAERRNRLYAPPSTGGDEAVDAHPAGA